MSFERDGNGFRGLSGCVGVWALALVMGVAGAGVAVAQGPEQGGGDGVAMGPQGRMVRGTVTAAAADHLTVKTEAGETYSVVVTTNTRVMKDRQTAKIADVKAGDGVGAMGVIDQATKTVHAAVLMIVDAEQIKKARENLGKTYIAGKITAIDEVNLTILRSDGVSQKIVVDEGTSFRKGGRRGMRGDGMGFGGGGMGQGSGGDGQGQGQARGQGQGGGDGQGPPPGQSITLADVKVGDMVAGQGALKSGVFVPTQLMVMDASARRHGDGQGGPDGPGGPPPPPASGGTSPN